MAKSVEEIYEEAKKLIGLETEWLPGHYPVEYDPIRRQCHMVDDDNPLFLEPEYAKKTKWGGVPCPPFMVNIFGYDSPGTNPWPPRERPALPTIPTAGIRAVNLMVEWEFFKPVIVGERLSCKQRIDNIFIKSVRLDPKGFCLVIERIFANEAGEIVAILRNTSIRVRSAEQIREAGG